MNNYTTYELNPPNSYKNVLDEVEAIFETGPMPKLLIEFITLLGKEKEEWGGVKAMRACLKEFRMWRTKILKLNDKVATGKDFEKATCKDFEEFLFSLDREVIVIQGDESPITSKAVIQGVRETCKEPDPPSSSKTANQDPPKASNALKEPDRPSSSKTVMLKAQNILKEPDCPSSSKPVSLDQPKAPNTLKVKTYMGTGWDTDFPHLGRCSSRNLFMNLTIHDGKIQKTEVHKSSRKPMGEDIELQLFSLENDELVVKVSDHNDKFSGTVRLLVSKLKQGIHVIPLSYELGKPCNKARLLMRFMFG